MFEFQDWQVGLLSKASHKPIKTIFLPETENTCSAFSLFLPPLKYPEGGWALRKACLYWFLLPLLIRAPYINLYTFPRGQVVQGVTEMG